MQLGRRHRRIALSGRDRNPELGAGGKVEHLGIAADERDELELGQPFHKRAGKFDPLADGHDDLGITKPLDKLIQVARRLAISCDIVTADKRETFELMDHILVVIWNDDFHIRLASTFIRRRQEGEPEHRISTRIPLLFGIVEMPDRIEMDGQPAAQITHDASGALQRVSMKLNLVSP